MRIAIFLTAGMRKTFAEHFMLCTEGRAPIVAVNCPEMTGGMLSTSAQRGVLKKIRPTGDTGGWRMPSITICLAAQSVIVQTSGIAFPCVHGESGSVMKAAIAFYRKHASS